MELTLHTDADLDHALSVLAAMEGAPSEEIIRRAVLERYEQSGHRARVAASRKHVIDEWSDVLDRLGKV